MDIFSPIQWLADWVTYSVLSLEEATHLADAVNFFIYDSIKIVLLLMLINYIMAIVRYYLPVEKIRGFLTKRKWYGLDYLLASSFGAVTPFCSCSSIPFFVGFTLAASLGLNLVSCAVISLIFAVLFYELEMVKTVRATATAADDFDDDDEEDI